MPSRVHGTVITYEASKELVRVMGQKYFVKAGIRRRLNIPHNICLVIGLAFLCMCFKSIYAEMPDSEKLWPAESFILPSRFDFIPKTAIPAIFMSILVLPVFGFLAE